MNNAMHDPFRVTFFVDVDNTLIDNDAAKREMDRRLESRLGHDGASQFWEVYEGVRAERSVVDIPTVLASFTADRADRALRFDLAELFMRFPFDEFVFPAAFASLAHLKAIGTVAILSDGDPVYQLAKITRSGLAGAVDGYVLVFPHKEEHLPEITAAFPADQYVLIDDKPGVIERVAARMTLPLSTVFVRQGRYAGTVEPGPWSGAGLTVESIGDLRVFGRDALIAAGRGTR